MFSLFNVFFCAKKSCRAFARQDFLSLVSVFTHKLQVNKSYFIFREHIAPFFIGFFEVVGVTFSEVFGKFVNIVFVDYFVQIIIYVDSGARIDYRLYFIHEFAESKQQ